METKILKLPITRFDNNIKDVDYLDMLSFSLRVKLWYGSSDMRFTSLSDLAKKLGVCKNTLKRKMNSKYFPVFFDIDLDKGRFIARAMGRKRHLVTLRHAFKQNEREMSSIIQVMFGKRVVMEVDKKDFLDNKKRRDIIRRISILIKINQQEYQVYSRKGCTIQPPDGAPVAKQGGQGGEEGGKSDSRVFEGCSYRRMSYKTGVRPTRLKQILKDMQKDQLICKTRRVSHLLKVGRNTDQMTREINTDNMMESLDYTPGEYFRRVNDGVMRFRSNVYEITPEGGTDNDLEKPLRWFEKGKKRETAPDIDREMQQYIDITRPDYVNGIYFPDTTYFVYTDKDGKEVRGSFEVNYNRGKGKRSKKSTPFHIRYAMALMLDLGKNDSFKAIKEIDEFLARPDKTIQKSLSDLNKMAKAVRKWHQEYNRSLRKLGIKPEPFSHVYHGAIASVGEQEVSFNDALRLSPRAILLTLLLHVFIDGYITRRNYRVIFAELTRYFGWRPSDAQTTLYNRSEGKEMPKNGTLGDSMESEDSGEPGRPSRAQAGCLNNNASTPTCCLNNNAGVPAGYLNNNACTCTGYLNNNTGVHTGCLNNNTCVYTGCLNNNTCIGETSPKGCPKGSPSQSFCMGNPLH